MTNMWGYIYKKIYFQFLPDTWMLLLRLSVYKFHKVQKGSECSSAISMGKRKSPSWIEMVGQRLKYPGMYIIWQGFQFRFPHGEGGWWQRPDVGDWRIYSQQIWKVGIDSPRNQGWALHIVMYLNTIPLYWYWLIFQNSAIPIPIKSVCNWMNRWVEQKNTDSYNISHLSHFHPLQNGYHPLYIGKPPQ